MLRLLVYVVPIGLAVYALIDLWRSTVPERGGLHPAAWGAIILFLPVVGPVVWLVVSRYLRAETGGQPARPSGPVPPLPSRGAPPRRRGPVAPDDDPDFLWRLERESRRRKKADGEDEAPDEAQDGDGQGSAKG